MESITGPILGSLGEHVDCHTNFQNDVDDLRKRVANLKRRRDDMVGKLQSVDDFKQQVKEEVRGWLEDARRVIEIEMPGIEEQVQNVSYLSRGNLGRDIRRKIQKVREIYDQCSFPKGLVIKRPPPIGITLPTEKMVGEVNVKEKIWRHLMSHKVGLIGVCGIGGVGKTTIMKHIHNKLLKKGTGFKNVIWVTVSHPLNVVRLQGDIARKMGQNLQEDLDALERASMLMKIMKTVKYALILDDVWDNFTLQRVGIPEPTMANRCKIVITSRSVDVCNYLRCQIVKVPPLPEQESLNLFLDKVGRNVLRIPHLEGILKLMVAECAGLPLAIVVIAGSMRGVTDIREWSAALCELSQCVVGAEKDSEDEIFNRLKFSYDRLQNPSFQNCFLYCSLYPEDWKINREELIENLICQGLVKKLKSRRDMHNKGHAILNRLENNCLLEKAYGRKGEECVRMHDVVRDMALRIKSTGPGWFMVNARMGLTKILDENEWNEGLDKVSLRENEIVCIPRYMSPKCLMLSTLILEGNIGLRQIPECFFANMPRLKFLNLSYTGIKVLPNSISNLENLTTLILSGCQRLERMPSLAKLKALKKLDLDRAGLVVAPEGIEMLENLEYLDLSCPKMMELPAGIINKLFCLQYLRKQQIFSTEIRGEEVARLKMLECFEGGFVKLKDFNRFVSELNPFGSPSDYLLEVGVVSDSWQDREGYFWKSNNHFGRPSSDYPESRAVYDYHDGDFGQFHSNGAFKRVTLLKCEIGEEDELVLPDDLKDLRIDACNMEIGWAVSSCSTVVNNLEQLSLSQLRSLRDVVKVEKTTASLAPTISPHIFSNLKQLNVRGCSELKKLFPCELLQGQGLQNLEEIFVTDCDGMEEIIGWEEEEEGNQISITLPKLQRLGLMLLPNLKRICPERGVMVCDSLNSIDIRYCEKVKRIPFCLGRENGQPSLPAVKAIFIDNPKERWESVEWENPDDKNVLLPFVHYHDDDDFGPRVFIKYPPV